MQQVVCLHDNDGDCCINNRQSIRPWSYFSAARSRVSHVVLYLRLTDTSERTTWRLTRHCARAPAARTARWDIKRCVRSYGMPAGTHHGRGPTGRDKAMALRSFRWPMHTLSLVVCEFLSVYAVFSTTCCHTAYIGYLTPPEEDRATAFNDMHNIYLVKFGGFWVICERTDRQTDITCIIAILWAYPVLLQLMRLYSKAKHMWALWLIHLRSLGGSTSVCVL